RRQAIDLRHTRFGRDADALIKKLSDAVSDKPVRVGRWRVAAGVVALLLLGGVGLFATGKPGSLPWAVQPGTREQAENERPAARQAEEERKAKAAAEAEAKAKAERAEKERLAAAQAEEERKAKAAAEAEAKAKAERAEKERLAAAQAEEERKAKAAAEAEAKRKSEEAEQQRLATIRAEEERRKQAEAEARARYAALVSQGITDAHNGAYDRAIAAYSEAIRLDPK